MECERKEGDSNEKGTSSEEHDLLQRSNKKVKRSAAGVIKELGAVIRGVESEDVEMQPSEEASVLPPGKTPTASYSQIARGVGNCRNPLFVGEIEEDSVSDHDILLDCDSEDESCPTILLTKEEKRRLQQPWRNALIIKLFDRKLSYEVLIKRLRVKWSLKGDIALTDVGHAFYVVRLNNLEDYDFVVTQGTWLIGESYLTIRKWVPNFVAEDAPIRSLTAWVRIPHLSVEYFEFFDENW